MDVGGMLEPPSDLIFGREVTSSSLDAIQKAPSIFSICKIIIQACTVLPSPKCSKRWRIPSYEVESTLWTKKRYFRNSQANYQTTEKMYTKRVGVEIVTISVRENDVKEDLPRHVEIYPVAPTCFTHNFHKSCWTLLQRIYETQPLFIGWEVMHML